MEVIQNKKYHNSYRGETSDKGNVRWRIPLFLPLVMRNGIKNQKWGNDRMTSGFEKSGTVLTVHLPAELDHPASELIRRESDRIMGKIYIRTICFDFGNTVFMDSSGVGLIMGRYRALGDAFWLHEGLPCKRIY